MEQFPPRVDEVIAKIRGFGKENLADILHALGEAVPLITRQSRCRLYLEDLTSGTLNCVLATGRQAAAVRQHAFSLTDPDFLVARVFISQESAEFEDPAELSGQASEIAERCDNFVVVGIGGSALGNIALHSALNHPEYNHLVRPPRRGPRARSRGASRSGTRPGPGGPRPSSRSPR